MEMQSYKEEPWQDFSGESAKNLHAKCLWVLVIDTSISMEPHMQELVEGLRAFKADVENDPVASERIEVAIVEFHEKVKVRCAPKLIDDMTIPEFSTGAYTFMAQGLERAMQVLDTRVEWYRGSAQPYYVPFVVLITDGEPNGPMDVHKVATGVKKRMNSSKRSERVMFMAFGVDGANMELLEEISDPMFPPMYVRNANFSSLFQWLSTSTKIVSHSTPDDLSLPQMIAESATDQEDFQRNV